MINVRKANENDKTEIQKILKETDLMYPSQAFRNFFVAEKEDKIVGVVQLTEFQNFFYLGSLGVVLKEQHQGIGSCLLTEALKTANKAVYIYTLIPEFFKKFGFEITTPPPGLPKKEHFCEDCRPEKCFCMVHPHTKKIPQTRIFGVGIKKHDS